MMKACPFVYNSYLFKRFRLDVRKFAFSNRVVAIVIKNHHSVLIAAQRIHLKHLSAELEPETAKLY